MTCLGFRYGLIMLGLIARLSSPPFPTQGVFTIYKNHPVGNFRHKHKQLNARLRERELF